MVAGGLVLHGAILAQGWSANPFARQPVSDAEVYWEWAGRIAAGEIVGDAPFFSAPLYPYLAGLARALGAGLLGMQVVQLLLHVATALVLLRIGRRRFSPAVGWATAVLWLVLGDPAYYVGRVLAGPVQVLVGALVLERAIAFDERPTARRGAALGACTGIYVLAWPPAIALVPLLALWAAWIGGWSRPALARAGVALACCALAIAPATLHNHAASGDWIPITAHGGVTFYHGNNAHTDGTFFAQDVSDDKRVHHLDALMRTREALGPGAGWGDVSGYYLGLGLAWWRAEPLAALGLALRKAAWSLAGRAYGDIYLPTLEREEDFGSLQNLALVPVAACTLPALVGALLLLRRPRRHAVELALVAVPFAVCTVFWYSPRYRLPATPFVALLAVVAVARAVRSGRPLRLAVGGALILSLVSGVIVRAAGFDDPQTYRGSYQLRLGEMLRKAGRLDEAEARYRAALDAGIEEAAVPLANLSLARDPRAGLARLRQLAAQRPGDLNAQRSLAIALAQLQLFDEARPAFERALALDDFDGQSWAGLGNVELLSGRFDGAEAAYERALELLGPASDLLYNLGLARRELGDLDGAAEAWRRTLDVDPAHPKARAALESIGRGGG